MRAPHRAARAVRARPRGRALTALAVEAVALGLLVLHVLVVLVGDLGGVVVGLQGVHAGRGGGGWGAVGAGRRVGGQGSMVCGGRGSEHEYAARHARAAERSSREVARPWRASAQAPGSMILQPQPSRPSSGAPGRCRRSPA
ncbi:MAG: hypothetical protein J3K34DRAFT_18044 [Monoraphidium minutum]|nr:MAG: hypothetical protein J3K34DRAFT_18044 [Monoraphidium minutum]